MSECVLLTRVTEVEPDNTHSHADRWRWSLFERTQSSPCSVMKWGERGGDGKSITGRSLWCAVHPRKTVRTTLWKYLHLRRSRAKLLPSVLFPLFRGSSLSSSGKPRNNNTIIWLAQRFGRGGRKRQVGREGGRGWEQADKGEANSVGPDAL